MKIIAFIALLLSAQHSIAQGTTMFNNVYHHEGYQVIRGLKTTETGYLLVSESLESDFKYWVLINALDTNGEELWHRKYLFDPEGHGIGFNSLTEDTQGNFWICGWINNASLDTSNAFIFSFTPAGDSLLFIRDTAYDQAFTNMVLLENGHIVATGIDLENQSYDRVMLTEWDTNGQELWREIYVKSAVRNQGGMSLKHVPDNGYLIGAMVHSGFDVDPWVVKTDSVGTIQWLRFFDNSDWNDGFASFTISSDGYIYVGAGSVKEHVTSNYDSMKGFLVKLSMQNDLIWQKEYGVPRIGTGFGELQEDREGNIVAITASSNPDDPHESTNGWLLKVSQEGDSLWEKRYGFNYDTTLIGRSYAWLVDTTLDGGLVTAGFVQLYDSITGDNFQDVWVVKFDSNGCFDTIFDCNTTGIGLVHRASANPALKVWPNPTNGKFHLDLGNDEDIVEAKVIDLSGRRREISVSVSGEADLTSLPPGIYHLEVKTQKMVGTARIILTPNSTP